MEEPGPDKATSVVLPQLDQAAVRSTQTTLTPCEFLAFSFGPRAPLPPTMRLTKISTALGTLPAIFEFAPLPSTMLHTAVGAATRALCAARDRTPLPTAMGDAKVCASVYTFWAYPATIVKATLPSTMTLAQWRAPFGTFRAPSKDAPLPATMSFTIHGATLGPL